MPLDCITGVTGILIRIHAASETRSATWLPQIEPEENTGKVHRQMWGRSPTHRGIVGVRPAHEPEKLSCVLSPGGDTTAETGKTYKRDFSQANLKKEKA